MNHRDLEYTLLAEKLFQRGETISNGETKEDDLHLAAIVGKMLLDRNSELEEKLVRLQEIAKQASLDYENLARQLCNAKDNLMMKTNLSEELDYKLEEVEEENDELQKKAACLQTELTKRELQIEQLEGRAAEQTTEVVLLQRKIDELELENKRLVQERKLQDSDITSSTEDARLTMEVGTLQCQLAESKRSKKELEAKLSDSILQNEKLSEQVSRMEEQIEELKDKFTYTEEMHGVEKDAFSLKQINIKRSKSLRISRLRYYQTRSTVKSHLLLPPQTSGHEEPAVPLPNPRGLSLFSELDNQYVQLQQQFEVWMERCHCSASSEYKSQRESNQSSTKYTPTDSQPFQKMFDEVFKSLKETTAVAHKLLAKSSQKVDAAPNTSTAQHK